MKRHFRVVGRLDMASKLVEGKLTIDPVSGLVDVRRLRSRTRYTRTLSDVATWVVQSCIRADVFKARLARAAKRRKR